MRIGLIIWTVLGTVCAVTAGVAGYSFLRSPSVAAPTASTVVVPVTKGDPAMRGGTATVRKEYTEKADDPFTTNDETNDQPTGHFGTQTITVYNPSAGHTYTLDADIDDTELRRIYFPKGGWIDFDGCDLNEDDLSGSCTDEKGHDWEIEGEDYKD